MQPLTPLGTAVIALAMLAVLVLPRRWAPVPMLLVACYMTPSVGVMLGQFNLFSIRLLFLAGLIRITVRGEYDLFLRSPLDRLLVLWAIWALVASVFRSDPATTIVGNGGFVFNILSAYFLFRSWFRSLDDVYFLCRLSAWLLVPVALEMIFETLARHNIFSVLGGVPALPEIREGRVRAQGPFAHSIMAGSVGAAMLPVYLGLWHRFRRDAILGIFTSLVMVYTSASSGPLLSSIFAVLGLLLWKVRRHIGMIRKSVLIVFGALMVLMDGRAYYLIERIDLAGGSASWHRARLIDMSIAHFGEWWLAGTDYTRHWMPTGVAFSPDHTDITNQYLLFGVLGGLPLMILFIMLLASAFSIVGRLVASYQSIYPTHAYFCWALGSSLFAQAATFISVAYIDQSFVFLYLVLAAIAALGVSAGRAPARKAHTPMLARPVLLVKSAPPASRD